jgi:hypothetical protein
LCLTKNKKQQRRTPMNQNEIIKQALAYNRKGIETLFEAVETVQGKAEEYTGKALEQAPEQGREWVRGWFEAGRKARAGLREAILRGHEQFEKTVIAA